MNTFVSNLRFKYNSASNNSNNSICTQKITVFEKYQQTKNILFQPPETFFHFSEAATNLVKYEALSVEEGSSVTRKARSGQMNCFLATNQSNDRVQSPNNVVLSKESRI